MMIYLSLQRGRAANDWWGAGEVIHGVRIGLLGPSESGNSEKIVDYGVTTNFPTNPPSTTSRWARVTSSNS